MPWNWQQPDWPSFSYDSRALEPLERQFLLQSGEFVGAFRHVGADDQETLRIELMSDEAVKTSEIEGEILDRASVQSSLRYQFGLGIESPGVKPAERGVSMMMVDLFCSYAAPLRHQTMFNWHAMLLGADPAIKVVGAYRTDAAPMRTTMTTGAAARQAGSAGAADRDGDAASNASMTSAALTAMVQAAPRGALRPGPARAAHRERSVQCFRFRIPVQRIAPR